MTTYRRRDEVSESRIDDDLFLVDPATAEIFHLDRMAAALWTLLAEPTERATIDATFAAAFPEIAQDVLAGDIDAALADLLDGSLVIVEED